MDEYQETLGALNELREVCSDGRPPLIWIGAGCSRWANLPSWEELAAQMHSAFVKKRSSYDKVLALDLLGRRDLPAFFSLCKRIDQALYFTLLAASLLPQRSTPVYSRFISELRGISPLQVITPNVDDLLEKNFSDIHVFSYAEVELAELANRNNQGFICKIDGSARYLT